MKNVKRWEYSKRLLVLTWFLIFILLPVSIWASVYIGDISPIREYVVGAFGLATIAHGFYYWKAKNENLHKYGRDEEINND